MGYLTTARGFTIVGMVYALSSTIGMIENIVVSAVPTVQDQPFPRAGMLYAYTFKAMETSFSSFSAVVLVFGAIGRIKPALTVFLVWNSFSTVASAAVNLGLFYTKTRDDRFELVRKVIITRNMTTTTPEPDKFDLTSIARFFSQFTTIEYFYARLGITVVATAAKICMLYQYIMFYFNVLWTLPYSYQLQE
ncbi:uncharacterized protein LOC144152369 [Haemaphysalis longicornis]